MSSSLSNLVSNLPERIHKTKCKYGRNDTNCEILKLAEVNINIATVFLNPKTLKMI